MSLEFEIPLISFIFMLLLALVYFGKTRVSLVENRFYNIILICTLIEASINTYIHFVCAMNKFSVLQAEYYTIFNFLNKILALLFITIFGSLFCYTLIISNEKIKNNVKYLMYSLVGIILFFAVLVSFTNVELIAVGNVTNVKGLTVNIAYFCVAVFVVASLIVALINVKKIDKRYLAIYVIILIVGCLYLLILIFPEIIIYDFGLAIFCYIMYFTIENPDVKMINELNIAKDSAEKANNYKTEFLSNMSHEIRTPLNAIVGFSQALMNEDIPQDAKDEVKDIVMASNILLDLVNGILDISKIEANKLEIINHEYDPRKMLSELVALTKARMGEKPLDFRTNFDPTIPQTLYGDQSRIKQVILNLLTNSVKYTKAGFVEFKVDSIIKNDICRLIITVEDSGVGIKKEDIDKLFRQFERLSNGGTSTEGTGLGLAITRKLVELMGGQIIVNSVFGQGSKFSVAIDQRISHVEVKEDPKIHDTQLIQSMDFTNKKVLLVDDNKMNLKVASRLLAMLHIESDMVDSGYECIGKIKNGERYDLILLDDMMPKMSGTETLQILKGDENFNIPVVALTANAISGMREKYLESGFNDYLAKPIEKTELYRVLIQYLVNEQNK